MKEYKVVTNWDPKVKEHRFGRGGLEMARVLETVLNEYAAEGWRLVASPFRPSDVPNEFVYAVLERERGRI